MKSSYVLDTSFLSAFVNTKDINHKQAKAVFQLLLLKPRLIIPASVTLELLLLRVKLSEFEKISFKDLFFDFNIETIDLTQGFLDQFGPFISATLFPLKPIDYSVLFTCYLTNSELLTFDKKLEKYYRNLAT